MVNRFKDETTGCCTAFHKSPGLLAFVLLWVFFLISASSLSTSTGITAAIIRDTMDTTMANASMPLWGGAASLDMSLSMSGFETEIKLHHFDQVSCGNCHQGSGTTETSLLTGETDMTATVNINQSCTSFGCHEYDQTMNHPIGVSVTAGPSAQMLSNGSSGITCLTCHETDPAFEANDDRILTLPDSGICQSCHEGSGGSQKERAHWRFSQKAHLISLNSNLTRDKYSDDPAGSGVDWESQICLTCHDEITANLSGIAGMEHVLRGGSEMSEHPIGMNYQHVLNTQSRFFNSLRSDEKKLRMFDGSIGCGTCHSLYSQIPYYLVVENTRSDLCRECHIR